MKTTRSEKIAELIWYKIKHQRGNSELTDEFRSKFGIPKDGIKNKSDLKKFLDENRKNSTYLKALNVYTKKSLSFLENNYFYIQFEPYLIRYAITGSQDLKEINLTGCEFDFSSYRYDGTIKINIGLEANSESVKEFINTTLGLIKILQANFRRLNNVKKHKRIKVGSKLERDFWVRVLSQRPLNDLQYLAKSKNTYKDQLVAKILSGKKNIGKLTDDNVRRIIAAQNKMLGRPKAM